MPVTITAREPAAEPHAAAAALAPGTANAPDSGRRAMPEQRWLRCPSPYEPVWDAMREFTELRTGDTPDQLWLVEHGPVYTLGQAGKPEHILNSAGIPVVRSDRGGQVTYHGPGQVVAYSLIDLRRLGMFVKEYVAALEDAAIDTLEQLGLQGACRKDRAPGVYVPRQNGDLAKIAALGIKVRNGCTYHGMSLNVDMDLRPFQGINPCGYEGLETVDLAGCGVQAGLTEVGEMLARHICLRLSGTLKARSPA